MAYIKPFKLILIGWLQIIGSIIILILQLYIAVVHDALEELLTTRFILSLVVCLMSVFSGLLILDSSLSKIRQGVQLSMLIFAIQVFYIKTKWFVYTYTCGPIFLIGYDSNEFFKIKGSLASFSFNYLQFNADVTQVLLNIIPVVVLLYLYKHLRVLPQYH